MYLADADTCIDPCIVALPFFDRLYDLRKSSGQSLYLEVKLIKEKIEFRLQLFGFEQSLHGQQSHFLAEPHSSKRNRGEKSAEGEKIFCKLAGKS